MRTYRFFSSWLLRAPREPIFELLWDSRRWPEWWPGVVEAVELDPGPPGGVGRRGRYEWRSRIPYPVRFEVIATEIEPPWLLAGRASGGLVGEGRWRLFGEGDLTLVSYQWEVVPGEAWMRALSPLLAGLFRRNHDHVMRAGAEGLARELGCELVARS